MPGFPVALSIQRCSNVVELNKLFKRLVTRSLSYGVMIIIGHGEEADAETAIGKLYQAFVASKPS